LPGDGAHWPTGEFLPTHHENPYPRQVSPNLSKCKFA
jgi:hypothetical protein